MNTLDLGCRFRALTLLLMCTKIYTNLTDETNFLQYPPSDKVKSLQLNIDSFHCYLLAILHITMRNTNNHNEIKTFSK